jgi:hypothetical protein
LKSVDAHESRVRFDGQGASDLRELRQTIEVCERNIPGNGAVAAHASERIEPCE